MKKSILLAVLSTAFFASTAFASESDPNQPDPSSYYESAPFVTVQAGTLGPGLDIGYQFSPYFDLRANVNGFEYNHKMNINSVKYDAHMRTLTAGLLADYYPFQNGFRLTAGAYYNGNKVYGDGHSTKDYYGIDPNDFGYEKASASYKKFAPYVGFGYQSNEEDSNWIFTADIGVMYQGSAKVSNSTVCYNGTICDMLQSEIDKENAKQQDKIQSEANKLKWYPVASIGVGYRF